MLYNLDWLKPNMPFPPKSEKDRLNMYEHNTKVFDMTAFSDFRISGLKFIGNFDDFVKFDVILNYQRLVTLKLADMVWGAFPSITAKEDALTDTIQQIRDTTALDSKMQAGIVDYSRHGVIIFRLFTNEITKKGDFTCWDPREWFPIIRDDGTNRIKMHVLAWRINAGTDDNPRYELHVQQHPIEGGSCTEEIYAMTDRDTIGIQIKSVVKTYPGYPCLVQYAANIPTTSNIYGTSDYIIINTLVTKAMERVKQILNILDVHTNPSLCGPSGALKPNDKGELVLELGKYLAIEKDDQVPQYLTWDGKLDSAFKALEFLLKQIYTLSEMGDAFLGASEQTGQAISGTAMRFKMASPLIKARRVSNALALPVKKLMATLLKYEGSDVKYQDLSIKWEDSLPKDPREQAELVKIQTGETAIMPLKTALMEQYDMTSEDAQKWIEAIDARKPEDNGTMPNPLKKGSDQSLTKGTEGATGTQNTAT